MKYLRSVNNKSIKKWGESVEPIHALTEDKLF